MAVRSLQKVSREDCLPFADRLLLQDYKIALPSWPSMNPSREPIPSEDT